MVTRPSRYELNAYVERAVGLERAPVSSREHKAVLICACPDERVVDGSTADARGRELGKQRRCRFGTEEPRVGKAPGEQSHDSRRGPAGGCRQG